MLQTGDVLELAMPRGASVTIIQQYTDSQREETYLASSTTLPDDQLVQVAIVKSDVSEEKKNRFIEAIQAQLKNLDPVRLPSIQRGIGLGRHDVGGESLPFLVVEHVEGERFDEYLEKIGGTPLEPVQALDFVAQMAGILFVLHTQKIIYRGVTPHSFTVRKGSDAMLVVTSFRAVKQLLESATHTMAGTTVSEMAVSSPEQLKNKPSIATDFWQLGVMLYRLLTGREPFVEMGGDRFKTIQNIHQGRFARYQNEQEPAFAEEVNALFEKLFTVDAFDRLQACGSMESVQSQLNDLRQVAENGGKTVFCTTTPALEQYRAAQSSNTASEPPLLGKQRGQWPIQSPPQIPSNQTMIFGSGVLASSGVPSTVKEREDPIPAARRSVSKPPPLEDDHNDHPVTPTWVPWLLVGVTIFLIGTFIVVYLQRH